MIKDLIKKSVHLARPHAGNPMRKSVSWGDLRRTQPISRLFGLDRGQPIDRYYIEQFLDQNKDLVLGRCLEVEDNTYTHRFGAEAVTQSDVLHLLPGNPKATLVGNLESGENIPTAAFNSIILTQTLQVIHDVRSAIQHAHNALLPGGTLLATVSGISQISRYDMDRWGEHWRFTDHAARQMFTGIFGDGQAHVQTYGNVMAATAMLQGLAADELTHKEINYNDPDYQIIVAIRAQRPA